MGLVAKFFDLFWSFFDRETRGFVWEVLIFIKRGGIRFSAIGHGYDYGYDQKTRT